MNDNSVHSSNIMKEKVILNTNITNPDHKINKTTTHNSKLRTHFINGISGLIACGFGKVQLQVGDLKQKAKINSLNIIHLYRGFMPP